MQDFMHPVVDFDGRCSNRSFAEIPRLCPICDHHVEPWRLAARATSPDDRLVDFAFQCSRPECRRMFVARYHLGPDDEYDLIGSYAPHASRRMAGIEVQAAAPV
jgi:hypothetical protein